jgi:RNA polymerase sigma-70 factor (ECF subfamily)
MAEYAGDPVAVMQQLHDEHAAALWHWCLRLTGSDRARAEDIMQETFLRAWRSGPTDGNASLRAWLFRVARNIAIDEWRTKRSRTEHPVADVPEATGVPDGTDELLLTWVVADALTRLSAEHRAVLQECYFRGASVAEASQRLRVPEGTVKSRTHYALRALRLALEELGVTS